MGFLDGYIKKAVENTIGEMIAEEIAGQGAPDTPAGQPDTPEGQPDTPEGQPDTPEGQPDTPAGQPKTPAGQNKTGQNKIEQTDTDHTKIVDMIRKEVGAIVSSLKEGAKIPEKLTPEDAMASLVGLKKEEKK